MCSCVHAHNQPDGYIHAHVNGRMRPCIKNVVGIRHGLLGTFVHTFSSSFSKKKVISLLFTTSLASPLHSRHVRRMALELAIRYRAAKVEWDGGVAFEHVQTCTIAHACRSCASVTLDRNQSNLKIKAQDIFFKVLQSIVFCICMLQLQD